MQYEVWTICDLMGYTCDDQKGSEWESSYIKKTSHKIFLSSSCSLLSFRQNVSMRVSRTFNYHLLARISIRNREDVINCSSSLQMNGRSASLCLRFPAACDAWCCTHRINPHLLPKIPSILDPHILQLTPSFLLISTFSLSVVPEQPDASVWYREKLRKRSDSCPFDIRLCLWQQLMLHNTKSPVASHHFTLIFPLLLLSIHAKACVVWQTVDLIGSTTCSEQTSNRSEPTPLPQSWCVSVYLKPIKIKEGDYDTRGGEVVARRACDFCTKSNSSWKVQFTSGYVWLYGEG